MTFFEGIVSLSHDTQMRMHCTRLNICQDAQQPLFHPEMRKLRLNSILCSVVFQFWRSRRIYQKKLWETKGHLSCTKSLAFLVTSFSI
jgi:hypothetical protein